MNKPVQVEKYGCTVWSNAEMDDLRRQECLCLNCARLADCDAAWVLLDVCKEHNLALAVTRCPLWQEK